MKKFLGLALVCLSTCAFGQVVVSGSVTISGPITAATGTPAPPPFIITGPSGEPAGTVNVAYSSTPATTANGKAPIAFSSLVSIPGLAFNSSTGVYSGTPSTAGNYSFALGASDSSNPPKTAPAVNLTIAIQSSGPPGGGHNEYCNSSDQWTGPASEPLIGGSASAPTSCLNTAMANTPSPGSTVTVTAGSCTSLQNAITNAVAGETIVIPAMNGGVQDTFTNCRISPATTGNASNWITVETDQLANLPAEGNRVSPAFVGIQSMTGYPSYSQPTNPGIYMPKIITSSTGNYVVQFQNGAAYWRFIGIEITSPSGATAAQLIEQATPTSGVNHIIWDRSLCHGGNSPTGTSRDQVQACWGMDGVTYGAVIDSYWYDTHTGGGKQSQAITMGGNSTSASGPIKITNNFLSSSGEVLFSGGSGQTPPAVVLPSSDEEIRLNQIFKPLFWKASDPSYFGTNFELDNCMEMKNTQRAWIEGNIFEFSTGSQGTQQGNCIIIGPRSQSTGFSGSANIDASGNVTWLSGSNGQQFSASQVSQYCAAANHCMFVYNSKAYQVASVTDATHLVLQLCNNGCPNAGGVQPGTSFAAINSVAYGAALPGLNPNAVGNDIIFINNRIHGAARVGAVAIAVSNNGDVPKSLQRVYIANNAADWIDGYFWNNNATQACCVWATGWQISSLTPLGVSINGLTIAHNTLLTYITGGSSGIGPSFGFGNPSQTVNNLQITDNLTTSGYGNGANGSVEALFTSWVPKAQLCFDHNIFMTHTNPFGPNGKGNYNANNNAPYPSASDSGGCGFTTTGNSTITDFNAADFTSIDVGNSIVNMQLTASSPGHNAASDGTDVGVNWTTLQNAIAGVGGLEPVGSVLTTSDSLLNTGGAITGTCTVSCGSGVNSIIAKGSNNLWLMFTDTFKITSGSGTITQAYPGTGSYTTTVSLSGLNNTAVNAFPFLLYGCDPFSDCYNGQPPQFPAQLSSMTNLYADIKYSLTGTITGSNQDLLFDEWVCNNNHPSNSNQCLEVEILPYYSFVQSACNVSTPPNRTITQNVVVNGTATTMSWDECVGGNVLFVPHTPPGSSGEEIKFDLLLLLNQAITDWGATAPCTPNACSWLTGIELGTEFGDATSQSYSLGFTKIEIDQVLP